MEDLVLVLNSLVQTITVIDVKRQWLRKRWRQPPAVPPHLHLCKCSSQKTKTFCFVGSLAIPSLTLGTLLLRSGMPLIMTYPLDDVPHGILTALCNGVSNTCDASPSFHFHSIAHSRFLSHFSNIFWVLLWLQIFPQVQHTDLWPRLFSLRLSLSLLWHQPSKEQLTSLRSSRFPQSQVSSGHHHRMALCKVSVKPVLKAASSFQMPLSEIYECEMCLLFPPLLVPTGCLLFPPFGSHMKAASK